MIEYIMVLNYCFSEQYVIFWHWQLKSIPNASKNMCFLLFSFFSLACFPSSNGMRNVWREDRMPLLGLQCGTGDVVASNALYWETTSSFRALLLA